MTAQFGNVVITGASSGIGRALAMEFAPNSAGMAILARRRQRLENLAEELRSRYSGLRVVAVPCDLLDEQQTEQAMETIGVQLGEVDVLINNAGFGDNCFFEDTDWRKLEDMIDLNVKALTHWTWRYFPGMRARNRGGVINVSSFTGLIFLPGYSTYSGTKHFVNGFTESLRCETVGTNVTVTLVCPGPVDTEFHTRSPNRTGMPRPSMMVLQPDSVARDIRKGFEAGRPMIIPGFVSKLLDFMVRLAPRFVCRWVLQRMASRLRAARTKKGNGPSRRGPVSAA